MVVIRVNAVAVSDETGRSRGGYGVSGDWRARSGLDLRLGWADAPESSEGITVDVQVVSFGVDFDVAPDTRLRLGMAREYRDTYDRTELMLALTRTF